MTDRKLVALRSYPAAIPAELAKSALNTYGIDALIQGVASRDQRSRHDRPIELWVAKADVEQANAILGSDERFSM